jgi:pimeloyl-ACP methyl ester carboxylesterase
VNASTLEGSKWLRRVVSSVAGLAVASVALSGCFYLAIPESGPTSTPAPTRTQSPNTEGVPAELLRFYEQPVQWSTCKIDFQCATIAAPLDWDNPDGAEIKLALARHLATGTPRGSLVLNPGGPGGSGVSLVVDSMDYAVGKPLIAEYDIVGFDPRGVGDSSAVSCLDDAGMDRFNFGIATAERGSDAWEKELLAIAREFADACEQNSGGILAHISTVNSARDLDLIRGVLGDAQLNYLGYSYGTFLGSTYAKLFPQRVGRLVLDGAIDPAIPGVEVGVVQAIGFEAALRAYMADCLTTVACPFAGTVDDAMADLGAMLASLDASPLASSDGRMLGADAMMTAIVAMLYLKDNWLYLTLGITGVLAGDADMALLLADFYYNREGGVYLDNTMEAFHAYNCIDYPLDADPAVEAAAMERIEREAPTIAPYWAGPDLCSVWPHPATGVREPITASGTKPIVVIGTTNDPATPYEWSVALAQQLEEGVLVTRIGEGHTAYMKGNVCVNDAVEAFFLRDLAPSDGLRCEDR